MALQLLAGNPVSVTITVPSVGATTLTGTAPPLAPVTVFKGTSTTAIGTAFADVSGVWSLALGTAAAAGDTYRTIGDAVTVLTALGLSTANPSVAASAAPGTAVVGITGLMPGETLARLGPNDGRFAINAAGDTLLVGLSALSQGTVRISGTTSLGRLISILVAVSGPALGALTLSPATATVGAAYSGTISGRVAGSTLALSGPGAAGLSVNSGTGAVSGTPTANGSVDITETPAGGGSSRTSSGVLTVGAGADPNRWMFGATNLHRQYQFATADANSLSSISSRKIGLPDWPVKSVRPVFANGIIKQTTSTPEEDTGNPITVSWGIQDGDTTFKQGLFGGAASISIPSGGVAVGDALAVTLAANADSFFRTICTVANVGDRRPSGIPRQQHRGEGIENTAAPQPGKLSGATTVSVVNAANGTALAGFYAPVALLVQGWDGREVFLMLGDSQTFADGDISRTVGARGVNGPIQRGLDDNAGGTKRLPFGNFAMSGTSPNNVRRTAGQNQRGFEILDAIKAVNGGKDAFTSILSEHINNAVTADVALLRSDMVAYLTVLRNEFPGAKIKQTSAMQRTLSNTDNSKWTTLAGQTWAAENRYNGARFIISDEMMSKSGQFATLIDTALDLRSSYAAGPNLDAWAPMPFSTTMAAALSANGTDVILNANPFAAYADMVEAPMVLAFDVDTANVKASNGYIVIALQSDNGDGTFTVRLNAQVAATIPAGASVKEVPTSDGAHSSASNNQRRAVPAFRAFKNAGLIG